MGDFPEDNLLPPSIGFFADALDVSSTTPPTQTMIAYAYIDSNNTCIQTATFDEKTTHISIPYVCGDPQASNIKWDKVLFGAGRILSKDTKELMTFYKKAGMKSAVALYSIKADGSLALPNQQGAAANIQQVLAGVAFNAMTVGDVDGDKLADLVLSTYDSLRSTNTISFYINQGGGVFIQDQTHIEILTSYPVSSLAIGDVDGMGGPDVVASNGQGQQVYLYLNQAQLPATADNCQ